MKKTMMIMLIAVIAIASVFATSGVSAKVGYDMMSFGVDENAKYKFNGLSFGLKGEADVCKDFGITASVDGILPFYEKGADSDWTKIEKDNVSFFGLKAKAGVAYTVKTGSPLDVTFGLDGIYSAMFEKADAKKGTVMNAGIGADIAANYKVSENLSVGATFSPELMFGTTYEKVNEKWNTIHSKAASFACSGQIAVTYNF